MPSGVSRKCPLFFLFCSLHGSPIDSCAALRTGICAVLGATEGKPFSFTWGNNECSCVRSDRSAPPFADRASAQQRARLREATADAALKLARSGRYSCEMEQATARKEQAKPRKKDGWRRTEKGEGRGKHEAQAEESKCCMARKADDKEAVPVCEAVAVHPWTEPGGSPAVLRNQTTLGMFTDERSTVKLCLVNGADRLVRREDPGLLHNLNSADRC